MILTLAAAVALQLSSPMLVASTCQYPNKDAKILTAAQPPFSDAQLKNLHTTKPALILVSLDGSGKVVKTAIAQSSGSTVVDRAAIAGAKASTYAAATRDCTGVPGHYLFRVEINASRPQ